MRFQKTHRVGYQKLKGCLENHGKLQMCTDSEEYVSIDVQQSNWKPANNQYFAGNLILYLERSNRHNRARRGCTLSCVMSVLI